MMKMKTINRITQIHLQLISSRPNLSKTSVILKILNRNTGVQNKRNLVMGNNPLNKQIVVMVKNFLNFAMRERQCIYALSFQTIILRQSLSSVLAENRLQCMKPEISAASKNIWICQIMNGKSLLINVCKRMKMLKEEW